MLKCRRLAEMPNKMNPNIAPERRPTRELSSECRNKRESMEKYCAKTHTTLLLLLHKLPNLKCISSRVCHLDCNEMTISCRLLLCETLIFWSDCHVY